MKDLPEEYTAYCQGNGIKEGEADFEFGGYFRLEALDGLEEFNQSIELEKYAPGFVAFGSDGGGEIFVFDEKGVVYLMPLIGMSPDDAIKIADSWKDYETEIIQEPRMEI